MTSDSKRSVVADFAYKISVPRVQRNVVERTSLLLELAKTNARVVVFHAPAGHGKTSVMLQVDSACAAKNWQRGWLSLDNSDNDLGSFRRHLCNMVDAMRTSNQGSVYAAEAPDDEAFISPVDWILNELLGLGSEVAIFLDDLHAVDGEATLNFLRDVLALSPDRIHWFIACRQLPEIGLPRLVVGDEALVVEPAELRFSPSELRHFFAQDCSPPLSESEVETLYAATEGWPAAAQLYRLALRSPPVRQSLRAGQSTHLRELSGYLAENVLAQQSAKVQSFLLQTSILERMSAEQCDALLERTDSAEILEQLEHSGLFVRRLESRDGWFSYHALFAQFLRRQLQLTTPDVLDQMHVRAAQWYRQNHTLDGALHHLICAREFNTACEVFDQWAEALILDGYLPTVDHWCAQIPAAQLAKHPGLVAKIVWALTFLSRHRKLEPLLPVVRARAMDADESIDHSIALCMVAILEDDLAGSMTYIANIDPQAKTSRRFRTFGFAAVSNARGYAAMASGDFTAALKHLALGRALAEKTDAAFTLSYAMAKTGITLVAQGHLREALVHFRSAMSDPRMFLEESVSTVSLACSLIMALYEADETSAALDLFTKYRGLIVGAGLHDYLVICYRAIARIHDLNGNPDTALEVLDEAETCAFAGHWTRAIELFRWERVRRELLAGQLPRAIAVAGQCSTIDENANFEWIRLSEEAEDPWIGKVRLAIHSAQFAEAISALAPLLRVANAQRRVFRQVKLYVLAALAYQGLGEERLCQRSLDAAIRLAMPGKFVRVFLDEGPLLTQLLQSRIRHDSAQADVVGARQLADFVRDLVLRSGCPAPEASYFVGTADDARSLAGKKRHAADALTKKEAIVLNLIASYLSNDQIAESLFVSRDTVKYHIKNIYSKLGVKNRLEAIRAASRVGLGDRR